MDRQTLLVLLVMLASGLLFVGSAPAQEQPLPIGFHQLDGKHVRIITDLPLDDELRQLPAIFDAAMPGWRAEFGVKPAATATWRATAYIMLDRQRFQQAGLIPSEVPNFPFGFQYCNDLWVVEQPSAYYRRHLLLHEGTHWFMQRKYGTNGPPWVMEGMAEWLGTHRWDGERLTMGVIPVDKQEVPYWGRITLLQQQLQAGTAPSLETILRYDSTAHQRVEAYAWSWAAVVFLKHHPETKQTFEMLLKQPMKDDASLTRWLFARLKARWPELRQEWRAFLTDLEYGYDLARGMLSLDLQKTAVLDDQPVTLEIAADGGWQSAGVRLEASRTVTIECSGQFGVGTQPDVWVSEPDGVTLEYYQGRPLGMILLTTLAPLAKEPEYSRPLNVIGVGRGGEYLLEPGELFFRVNESMAGLADNTGTITITIKP
jgi:hypothetical protein